MTVLQMLEHLTDQAAQFRKDTDHYSRNRHMHAIIEAPSQDVIDAVLTGFINHVGRNQCIDYALYASDLKKREVP